MLGTGILKGLLVTARNFIGSYTHEERLVTVQYPEERLPQPENARNFPFLVHDGNDPNQSLRCVACLICEKECPPQCIYIVKDAINKVDRSGRLQSHPRIFDIDISVCMGCQICVEVCPFDAIKMDTAFELSNTDRFSALLLTKEQLAKSNEYFHQIHPADAAEVDARLAEERNQAEAKKTGATLPLAAALSQPVPP